MKTIIEKAEQRLKDAKTPADKVYLSAFLDGAKAQKEEDNFLLSELTENAEKIFSGGVCNG